MQKFPELKIKNMETTETFIASSLEDPGVRHFYATAATTSAFGSLGPWRVEFVPETTTTSSLTIFQKHVIQINESLSPDLKRQAFLMGLADAILAPKYEQVGNLADDALINRIQFVYLNLSLKVMSRNFIQNSFLSSEEAQKNFDQQWPALRNSTHAKALTLYWDKHFALSYYLFHPPKNEAERIDCLLSTINGEYSNFPVQKDRHLILLFKDLLGHIWPNHELRVAYCNKVIEEISNPKKREKAKEWLEIYLEGMAPHFKKTFS